MLAAYRQNGIPHCGEARRWRDGPIQGSKVLHRTDEVKLPLDCRSIADQYLIRANFGPRREQPGLV
jgi:hypothetical protein